MTSSVLDLFRLDGRVAIVTGASSGLGVAFARALAQAGADLVLAARRADRLEDTRRMVAGLGRRAIAVPTDVTDPAACSALVDRAVADFGRVDILVNNAGVGTAVPALKETPEQFRGVVELNLNGCYWMAQACARVMRPGSSIVNISSVIGITTAGLPQAAYSASKAGLIGLTRDLAQQWTGTKRHPGQRHCPRLLRIGDDRAVHPRVRRTHDWANSRRPPGRPGGTGRRGGLPGEPGQRLRHRPDAGR